VKEGLGLEAGWGSLKRSNESCKRALEEIAAEVKKCRRCPLHATRTKAVPGEGDPCADVMLIGEAPGYNEDIQGRPFVGAAGNLLNEMLRVAGLSRGEVFITNVLKCRPPGNRDPREGEIEACKPFLIEQIEIVQPKIIVCLGRHSARVIFGLAGWRFSSIMKVRGNLRRANMGGREVLILPTLHPAAALYNPRLKDLLVSDFRLLGSVLNNQKGLDRWL